MIQGAWLMAPKTLSWALSLSGFSGKEKIRIEKRKSIFYINGQCNKGNAEKEEISMCFWDLPKSQAVCVVQQTCGKFKVNFFWELANEKAIISWS